ncbi:hypothetical protein UPYG_G00202130 [Umbra pygmaea]|uniref:Tudor domain-containing protein n=1 Tax=Umbra pygmaea TaxID=75934 RepID=A0ABD0WN94_UMBPY
MPLRFRSIVPYTLPGVLALLGWWWYISRKKERITRHDSEEGAAAMGLLVSPPSSEGSNGLVEKGTLSPCPTAMSPTSSSCRSRAAQAREQHLTELEVVAQIHIPASKAVDLHTTSLSATERLDPAKAVSVSCHQTPKSTSSPPTSPLPTQTRVESSPPQEEHSSVVEETLSADVALVTELVKPTVTEEAHAPVVESVTTASEALVPSWTAEPTAAQRVNAERPEPEGEVAAVSEAVALLTQNLQQEAVAKDLLPVPSNSTKDQVSSTPVVPAESPPLRATHETPTSPQDSYHAALTSTLACSSPCSSQQENGAPSSRDLEHMAAGLITEVISAATQEVLTFTSSTETRLSQLYTEPGYSSTPLANGRPCPQQDRLTRDLDDGPSPISQSETSRVEWRDEHKEGLSNGCPATWEPMGTDNTVGPPWAAANTWQEVRPQGSSLDKLKAEEMTALAEDSACSTCHSEDGVSGEDQRSREDLFSEKKGVPAEASEEVATDAALPVDMLGAVGDVKRLNGVCLRNGSHGTSEAETDQSGGSDVNSMDSVDSGCTMGARDTSGSPAIAMGSELVVWEIEVPKHLVGRLIGKQGRYVSFLKQSSGAKIYISTLPYTQEFQICHIEGSQQQVDKALSLIGKKFKDLDLTNLYAPPPMPLSLPSLPMTSWLLLPSGVTVEVIVVNIVSAGHLFVQQHTHPTYHALRSLDQQMFLCYSQPGTPSLPSPAEVGVICAAPAVEGAWWRAQVITFFKETNEVEIRYVDYGGYDRVKIDTLRQIRSDFVTLPFQGAEVLLDNIAPLPGENGFSTEATTALEEMTRGVALLAQVSNYDSNTGLPLVQMWNMVGEELVSVNRTLAERALGTWVESF